MKKKGFTIVELLVVIVVIGILASITVFAYNGIQAKARDSTRLEHLQKIADAIKLYRTKNGNDIQGGSGCGYQGNGSGWFNLDSNTGTPDPNYTKSILSCLTDAGHLDSTFIDPSNCITTSKAPLGKTCKPAGYTYMKYSCGTGDSAITYLYARLEAGGNSQDLINANVCSSATVATSYSMNYMLIVD